MPGTAALSLVDRVRVAGAMSAEFAPADLGDTRLDDRLSEIAERLGRSPTKSIPAASSNWAETKATYRFCDNETVDPRDVLTGHVETHADRVQALDELLVVSDTTHLTFPSHPAKEGLGDVGDSTIDVEGVKLHSSIGIDPTTEVMTGLLDQQVLIQDQAPVETETHETNGRDRPELLGSEHEKWLRGDRAALDGLPGDVRPVFVHDRGGDAFSFYRHMAEEAPDAGYVIRANQNRSIHTAGGDTDRLFDRSASLPERGRTTIEIQQGNGRPSREAELSIKAGTCDLLAPKNNTSVSGSETVNVVRVDELDHDDEDEEIQWVLLTTEAVETFEDVMTVLGYYRARWKIEDWHRVLKSGCRIEDRQLEMWERMEVLLSIYSVVAWKVLELRELGRGTHEMPPERFLSEAEQAVLEAEYPEIVGKEDAAYAVAVAKVGGYLDRGSDPPPGWETMWKGLQEVRVLAKGYELGSD